MDRVIGRFRVGSVEDRGVVGCWDYEKGESGPVPQVAVRLQAITKETDQSDFDNRAFYRSTPQGTIEMVIQNPSAAEQFQVGDLFNVEFERIDQAA